MSTWKDIEQILGTKRPIPAPAAPVPAEIHAGSGLTIQNLCDLAIRYPRMPKLSWVRVSEGWWVVMEDNKPTGFMPHGDVMRAIEEHCRRVDQNRIGAPTADSASPWHVYEMNDCDWWLARSPDEARQSAVQYYGSQENNNDLVCAVPRELTAEEMDSLIYYPDGNRNGASHTFRQELAARVANNPKPEFFATTEF